MAQVGLELAGSRGQAELLILQPPPSCAGITRLQFKDILKPHIFSDKK